ncbi:MAG: thiamine phosphate synthase [Desulfovibrio sp.]
MSRAKEMFETDIYCLTGEKFSLKRSNITVVQKMLDAGVKIIQYREKDKAPAKKYQQCVVIRKLTREAGAWFIVNDDVELAKLVKADGVHVGQGDMPIKEVREIVGPDMIIGLSTHSSEEAQKAVADGADYIGVGPIFPTETKEDVCDAVGFEYLNYVAENIDIPFVAIGGIKDHNVAEVVRQGASCVAMVTEIVGVRDIEAKVKEIRKIMQEAGGK